ncbi:hypothetical protein EJD97_015109 [Solanum chilense]|uniref:Uncharacterized protein n=1 Tax=Solanum chilense TaxID=4083 RepID=A0A6N2CBH6_SOLCI|nr:hypothetical protein EJD97_015109 [Solanum chilense]
MPYLITLGLVETIFEPVVDRDKMMLAGATTIRRDRVPNEVVNELVVFAGAGVGAGAGQHEGATSCRLCRGFLCMKCKKHDEDSIMYLQKLSEGNCIKECAACIYSTSQAEKRIICQGNAKFEEEDVW